MDIYEALYTTRAMRRVKPDPIPQETQARILDAAIRAPTGGNAQGWRFLLIDDPEVIGQLGPLFRSCIERMFETVYGDALEAANKDPDEPKNASFLRMVRSVNYMAKNFEGYPLLLTAFNQGGDGGSIFPGVWNAMLAARAEGVGSTITSVWIYEREKLYEILGVPEDQGWNFACLVPMGYPTGRWDVAPRRPVHEVSYKNQWGTPLGFEIPEPLWPPK
jgi:nitroreductase